MYKAQLRVRFADLDALNHVNHATMFTYAETVRCDWFEDVLGHKVMADLPFIVAKATCNYETPIPKTAALEVVMAVSHIGTKSWTFDYLLQDRQSGTVYARVQTVQVAYDYAANQTVPIDATLRKQLATLEGSA